MKAHLVQLDIAWEDAQANFEAVRRLLDRAPISKGDFVLLPEMFDTGFSFNTSKTVDVSGRTISFLRHLASDVGCVVQGGRTIAAQGSHAARNVMSVVSPEGALLCEYTKVHPFQREAERFEAGGLVETFRLPIGATQPLTISPAICYDLRFPELFRFAMLKGAEAFSLGACWPVARAHHWRALLIARAIENQAMVIGVNRCGRDPMLQYGGGSIAVGPKGDVLGELNDSPGVLSIDIDAEGIRQWRSAFSAIKDARLLAPLLAGIAG
ncbi:MAG: carbon-nitrogen family hydrolase [Planctomycetes bacterium]|nr:carbon-nitrogen family hydrolase [Planctomycetota bacterium]